MLLANISVATKIYDAFPDLAVLRSHPPPKEFMMDQTVDMLKNFGRKIAGEKETIPSDFLNFLYLDIQLDTSSSKSLASSLAQYCGTDADSRAKFHVLTSLCSKPMELATYLCAGVYKKDEERLFRHYALSVPLYTHFTSPIRRYPDVLVHRLLDAAIKGVSPPWVKNTIHKQTQHCNAKKLGAKLAGEESAKLFLALFIKECGPIEARGMVIKVRMSIFAGFLSRMC